MTGYAIRVIIRGSHMPRVTASVADIAGVVRGEVPHRLSYVGVARCGAVYLRDVEEVVGSRSVKEIITFRGGPLTREVMLYFLL